MIMYMYNNVGGHLKRNGCRSLDIIVRPLWSAVDRLSQSFPFQNVRFDRTVKRARLEQSGVKRQLMIDGIAEEFVRGNGRPVW